MRELKVPSLHDYRSLNEFGSALLELILKFLSWVISFVIVCEFWLNPHHVVGLARRADYSMVWLNPFIPMFQSFIPFPPVLMGEGFTNPLAVSLFGTVMAFNALLFIALHAYILINLITPDLVNSQDPHIILKSSVTRYE